MVRLLAPAFAFALAFACLRVLVSAGARNLFLDHPNERSLHAAPTPRTGGTAIVLGALTGMALAGVSVLVLSVTAGLAILSLLDDWRGIPSPVRLIGHLTGAAILVAGTFKGLEPLPLMLLVVAVGWAINLYNFMDGADGLAGGMATFGFATYAAAAWVAGETGFALAAASVAAAALAFLRFNFPPARIFMGDVGSIPLGFLAASLGLVGWNAGLWPLWFPLVVFAPFVVDASVTLLRRAVRGERFWHPHRSHYYQRQVLMGWSHRQLACAEYLLMLVTGGTALVALRQPPALQAVTLASLAVLYLALVVVVDVRWRARQEA